MNTRRSQTDHPFGTMPEICQDCRSVLIQTPRRAPVPTGQERRRIDHGNYLRRPSRGEP
jgi:hypothetical protein